MIMENPVTSVRSVRNNKPKERLSQSTQRTRGKKL